MSLLLDFEFLRYSGVVSIHRCLHHDVCLDTVLHVKPGRLRELLQEAKQDLGGLCGGYLMEECIVCVRVHLPVRQPFPRCTGSNPRDDLVLESLEMLGKDL